MTPKLSLCARLEQCTMRLQRVDGNRSLELLTLFSCPHQTVALYLNKGDTKLKQGRRLCHYSPSGRGNLRRQSVYSLVYP